MYWSIDVERFEAGILLTNPSSKDKFGHQKITIITIFIKGELINFLQKY